MKNKDKKIEILLKNALSSNAMPDSDLLQDLRLKLASKENPNKKPGLRHTFRISFVTIMLFVILSGSAFAAWQYLSTEEVADKFDFPLLAEAFTSDNAIIINETQQKNGFTVSLLGLISGNQLTNLDKTLDTLKTYAVVAIKMDSENFPALNDMAFNNYSFFISPLINGQKPWLYNIASMNGGYNEIVSDGILYHLIECDELEIFADRGLSLVVISSVFYDINAFDYDQTTGLVIPNENYNGLNLIFDLPISTERSDHEKAQIYLDNLWNKDSTPMEDLSDSTDNPLDSLDEYHDSIEEITVTRVTKSEDYQSIMDIKFIELEEMVEDGLYLQKKLSQDKLDFEKNLERISQGAILIFTEYNDGSFSVDIREPSN